jgi:hypothetical protein
MCLIELVDEAPSAARPAKAPKKSAEGAAAAAG